MMVISVSLRVVLATHIHDDVTRSQFLRIPSPHNLCILQGTQQAKRLSGRGRAGRGLMQDFQGIKPRAVLGLFEPPEGPCQVRRQSQGQFSRTVPGILAAGEVTRMPAPRRSGRCRCVSRFGVVPYCRGIFWGLGRTLGLAYSAEFGGLIAAATALRNSTGNCVPCGSPTPVGIGRADPEGEAPTQLHFRLRSVPMATGPQAESSIQQFLCSSSSPFLIRLWEGAHPLDHPLPSHHQALA